MNTQPPPANLKNEIRAIRVFFFAMVVGVVLFSIIVVVMNLMEKTESAVGKDLENIFLIVAVIAGITCLVVARRMYARRIAAAKDSLNSLPDKLNQYRAALILYMALCEGPALFSIIIFFITGNYYMFIITGVMLAAMLTKIPARSRLIDALGLSWQQQQEL